jgi:DNA polymerase-3 subunit delta'
VSTWGSAIAHPRPLGMVRRAADGERCHHAWLILGPTGVGKRAVAEQFARALLCEGGPPRPCGVCPSCRKADAGTHTDLHVVEPTGKSQTITVDQVSEVQRKLGYRRGEGRHRVVLFDGAGTLNVSAQNKLLKTLEEPPDGTILLLLAVHPGQLLVTVRSRTQKLLLPALAAEDLVDWLQDGGAAARAAAAASGGLPDVARALLDEDARQARTERLTQVQAALSGDAEAAQLLAREHDRDRTGAAALLDSAAELLRDAMVASSGADVPARHPDVPAAALAAGDPRRLAEALGRIEVVREQLGRNVHPGGLLTGLFESMEGA